MNGVIGTFIRRRAWGAAGFGFCCAVALGFCYLDLKGGVAVFLGPGLASVWFMILANTEQCGDALVFRMLPVSAETLSLAVWMQWVAMPLAVLMMVVAVCTVGTALYGNVRMFLPSTGMLIVWTGLWITLMGGLSISKIRKKARGALGLYAAIVLALFAAFLFDKNCEKVLSTHGLPLSLIQVLVPASAVLCALAFIVSFLLRKHFVMGIEGRLDAAQDGANPSGATPHFPKRRGNRHWAIARPLMGDLAVEAGTGAVLGWLLTLTNSDFGFFVFFAIVVGFKSVSRSMWAVMRVLVVLPMRKRDVVLSALAVSLLFVYTPLLSAAGVLYVEHILTAHPAPPLLTYFFAVQPLVVSIVFLFTGASTGTDCLRMDGLAAVGLFLVVVATLFALAVTPELFCGLGNRTVVFITGMLALPPTVLLSVRLLERSLDDNAFYRRVSAE